MISLNSTSEWLGTPDRPVQPSESGGSAGLRLHRTAVDVWRASLDRQPPEVLRYMEGLLSDDEIERARSFYFERDRSRFVVARAILRMLLGRYLERAPETIAFRYGPNGKPALASGSGATELHFNVAHSEGVALYAFTRMGEVGIDIECMRDLPDWEQVAESAFSPHELGQLRACPPEQRRAEFFRAWTRQEAVLKALGTGLGGVTHVGAESAFNVYPLEIDAGYAAALACSPAAQKPNLVRGWGHTDRSANTHTLQTDFL